MSLPGAMPPESGVQAEYVTQPGYRGIKVAAAVLSPDEIDAIFGLDLLSKGIEPIWFEMENTRSEPVHLLISGMDPEDFAPLEVAHAYRRSFAGERNAHIAARIESLALDYRSAILPGEVVSGFAFSNDEPGARVLDLDFVVSDGSTSMTLYVPEFTGSGRDGMFETGQSRFSSPELVDVDESSLRAALVQLPCCAEGADGVHIAPPESGRHRRARARDLRTSAPRVPRDVGAAELRVPAPKGPR